MKKRNGFVTNSSSTTYVCEISGESETFFDGGGDYHDYGFVLCENEHTLMDEFVDGVITPSIARAWIKRAGYRPPDTSTMSDQEVLDYSKEQLDYDIPEELCPICQFKALSQHGLAKYLEKKYSIPRDDVFAEVKKTNKRRKKLYDSEYSHFVMNAHELTEDDVLTDLRERFATIREFLKYIGAWASYRD